MPIQAWSHPRQPNETELMSVMHADDIFGAGGCGVLELERGVLLLARATREEEIMR